MNPGNRWVKIAETISWDAIEERYAELFSGKTGMAAKLLRTALGSLLIQKQLGFSDRELVGDYRNPYFQYFIGLSGYQTEAPFVPSLLVEFCKRLTHGVIDETNEMINAYNTEYLFSTGCKSSESGTGKSGHYNLRSRKIIPR